MNGKSKELRINSLKIIDCRAGAAQATVQEFLFLQFFGFKSVTNSESSSECFVLCHATKKITGHAYFEGNSPFHD